MSNTATSDIACIVDHLAFTAFSDTTRTVVAQGSARCSDKSKTQDRSPLCASASAYARSWDRTCVLCLSRHRQDPCATTVVASASENDLNVSP